MAKKEKVKKPFYKKWWVWIIALIIIGAAASGGESEPTTNNATADTEDQVEETSVSSSENTNEETEESTPEEEVTEDTSTEASEEETEEIVDDSVSFENGMFTIEEIEPGLYKSEGSFVYWERLAGFSGELDDIIANGNPMGTSIVEIMSTDAGFNSNGSGKWVKIEDDYVGEMATSFGDGMYIVGKDIEPGTYKNDGGSGLGYWARLSGFNGELENIIANGNPEGSVIVEISESDVGFHTFGSGTWTKVE